MATRSTISVLCDDGSVVSVYCHCDGYPEHNGKILSECYNSQELAEKLVSLGDMSSLGTSCDGAESHSFDSPVKNQTVYYHRDRGEELSIQNYEYIESFLINKARAQDYNYLFVNGQWIWDRGRLPIPKNISL